MQCRSIFVEKLDNLIGFLRDTPGSVRKSLFECVSRSHHKLVLVCLLKDEYLENKTRY